MNPRLRYLIPLVVAASSSLHAGTIDALYAFGDSLTDVGNAYLATGGLVPPPPYFQGQFSNGPVWIQDLAVSLGLPAPGPSLAGGSDYAVGSAQSGTTLYNSAGLADLPAQLAAFHAANSIADPNALYTIWIGSNDLAAITSTDPTTIGTDLGLIAGNIVSAIGTLAGEGAKNFLIVDVPDLGKTPEAIAGGPSVEAAESGLAAEFDYSVLLPALSAVSGVNLSVLDAYALVDGIVASPSTYGFSDVTDACLTGVDYVNYSGGTPCATPNSYLFWDREHPTAAADTILADAAQALVTPEPSSLAFAAIGVLGVLLATRRASSANLKL